MRGTFSSARGAFSFATRWIELQLWRGGFWVRVPAKGPGAWFATYRAAARPSAAGNSEPASAGIQRARYRWLSSSEPIPETRPAIDAIVEAMGRKVDDDYLSGRFAPPATCLGLAHGSDRSRGAGPWVRTGR